MNSDYPRPAEVLAIDAPKVTREEMPDWWPEDRPPEKLQDGFIYRGNDGRWRRPNGVLVSRAERRKAGVR